MRLRGRRTPGAKLVPNTLAAVTLFWIRDSGLALRIRPESRLQMATFP